MLQALRRLQDGALWDAVKPGARARALVGRAADALFPPHSFDAGDRPQATGFSAEAWAKVVFLEAPVCDGCGLPFEYDQGQGARCAACQARPFAFVDRRDDHDTRPGRLSSDACASGRASNGAFNERPAITGVLRPIASAGTDGAACRRCRARSC